MIVVLSPAKKLDFDSEVPNQTQATNPIFLEQTLVLVKELKRKSAEDLSKLMKISAKLGDLNAKRYKDFKLPLEKEKSRQAIFAFIGDTYQGFDVGQLSKRDLQYAQKSLRVLSGLYGMLSPLDLIMPYRLEMGTKFGPKGFNNLYEFWREVLTDELNKLAKDSKASWVVNCASKEYFSAVDEKSLNIPVVNPVFKEKKKGSDDPPKVIGLFSKKARGMMARFIVKERVRKPSDLESFNELGYKFSKKESTDKEFVFNRSY